jgi:aryl sulfotransferase
MEGTDMRPLKDLVMDNARWEGFEVRADDIFVCTPAKCGTTWMQTIVASLLFPDGNLPGPLMTISPWIEATFMMPADEMHRMLAAQTFRRAMKSHSPVDAMPWFPEAKYITVVRDGRDAFMSWCNHSQRMRLPLGQTPPAPRGEDGPPPMRQFDGDYHGYFEYWLTDNNYFDVVASFWAIRDRTNLLFSHFNDMKADLEGEMRRVARFIGAELREDQWPAVVKRCTFEAMQNNETPLADFDRMFEGGLKGFVYKGTNGRWRDELNEEDLARYRARVAELLPPDAAKFAEHGRKALGME